MRVVLPDSSQSLLGGGELFNFCFGVDGQHGSQAVALMPSRSSLNLEILR